MQFRQAFDELVDPQHEGGYVNNPKDPGGETNMGVTWPALRRAIAQGIVYPTTTIKGLTRDQAADIYQAFYWHAAGCDEIPEAVRYDVFDTAVNSGVERAVMFLQAAVGSKIDGEFGEHTAAAVAALDPYQVLARFDGRRLDFLNDLSTWPTFGKGWVQRIATNLMAA